MKKYIITICFILFTLITLAVTTEEAIDIKSKIEPEKVILDWTSPRWIKSPINIDLFYIVKNTKNSNIQKKYVVGKTNHFEDTEVEAGVTYIYKLSELMTDGKEYSKELEIFVKPIMKEVKTMIDFSKPLKKGEKVIVFFNWKKSSEIRRERNKSPDIDIRPQKMIIKYKFDMKEDVEEQADMFYDKDSDLFYKEFYIPNEGREFFMYFGDELSNFDTNGDKYYVFLIK